MDDMVIDMPNAGKVVTYPQAVLAFQFFVKHRVEIITEFRRPHERATREELARLKLLSPIELEVLRRIASGQLGKVTAYEMGKTENSIRGHVKLLMRKLKVINRTQAALLYNKVYK